MNFETLRANACDAIAQLGYSKEAKNIRYAESLGELHSCLREYVFHTDSKTNRFLQGIRDGTPQAVAP